MKYKVGMILKSNGKSFYPLTPWTYAIIKIEDGNVLLHEFSNTYADSWTEESRIRNWYILVTDVFCKEE